jgi:collagen type III alpha
LRQFVERWQQLKSASHDDEASTNAARRELDDALRSLGLRRGPLQQSQVKDDELRDLREGYRGPVPLEYQDRLRAYNEGISRSQQDGD